MFRCMTRCGEVILSMVGGCYVFNSGLGTATQGVWSMDRIAFWFLQRILRVEVIIVLVSGSWIGKVTSRKWVDVSWDKVSFMDVTSSRSKLSKIILPMVSKSENKYQVPIWPIVLALALGTGNNLHQLPRCFETIKFHEERSYLLSFFLPTGSRCYFPLFFNFIFGLEARLGKYSSSNLFALQEKPLNYNSYTNA